MTHLQTAFRTARTQLPVGRVPLVVGTLSSFDWKFPSTKKKLCDLVEVRLDKTGQPSDWLKRCKAIEARGWPVLLTPRLHIEGGDWTGGDEERLPYFEQGLEELSAVDIELQSGIARTVAKMARKLRKVCVISHHDFQKTPPLEEMEKIVSEAQEFASIVKISTRLNCKEDEQALVALLAGKWKIPLCVIGMGPEWAHTRVAFPKLGSCLAYGYLVKSTAPGQMSAAELTRRLCQKRPALKTND